jgi:hypothetical protein
LGISIRKDFGFCNPPHNLEKILSQGNPSTRLRGLRLARVLLNSPNRFSVWECIGFRNYGTLPCVSLFFEELSVLVCISNHLRSKHQDYSDFLFDLVIAGSYQVQLEIFCPRLRGVLGIRDAKSDSLSEPNKAIHFSGNEQNNR